jgi:hypothetical protein
MPVPDEVEILAAEETQDTIYLVLPPTTSAVGRGGEIPDQHLEAVAGGDPWGSGAQTNTDSHDRLCCSRL